MLRIRGYAESKHTAAVDYRASESSFRAVLESRERRFRRGLLLFDILPGQWSFPAIWGFQFTGILVRVKRRPVRWPPVATKARSCVGTACQANNKTV
ncbi:uncharacterized protein BJX67DRAFT_18253 [Aspergillus lucknowensis]|uniref:Uncharacterized protein n=1 Tax=Aspergillus lucknowensis TaxID=176173 RepID=A0ABR4M8B0_9EURO